MTVLDIMCSASAWVLEILRKANHALSLEEIYINTEKSMSKSMILRALDELEEVGAVWCEEFDHWIVS